ncbi:coiled-coil domain-containing protein 151 isoform X3 [Simochromis diagramma]|uniref:coiled-coil domain-containing protein 151 isoform X3 n=1 Tax=Simochromis diagramma TaxID=43689 RepID=UPI001A7EF031|nr:coiled-coil domain-containing protein 151 isoform X3 [Simochromis diagramma]
MAVSGSISDQKLELQRKIKFLEGEKTLRYERTEATTRKQKEFIRQLRQENENLRKQLAETKAPDEHIIKVAFKNRDMEGKAFCNSTVKEVNEMLNEGVLFKRKCINAVKHTNEVYQRRLNQLKMEYQRLKSESSSSKVSSDAHTRKKKDDAMEESLTYKGQLDCLEAEILKQREEMNRLQIMNNDQQLSKEATKDELQMREELLYKDSKERARIIASYRKKVKECKAQAEKVDVRDQITLPEKLSGEAQHIITRMEEEDLKKISTFEEAFRHISETTGVTDIQEILECFNSQEETHQHLLKLKEENEKVLLQLKEEKELLSQQFEEMKYFRQAKHPSDQQALQESEQQLQTQQQKCDAAKEQLDWLLKTLHTAQAGVEHLANKLQHISLSEDTVPEVDPDSDHFVLELMAQCEQKLLSLQKELEGMDVAAIMKEMEKNKLYIRSEEKLSAYITRAKPPVDQAHDPLHDKNETDEGKAKVITREALKLQSQLIIDSHSKRKTKMKMMKKKGKL